MSRIEDLVEKHMSKKTEEPVNEGGKEITELVLFITNDGDLYRQRITPIIKNLQKKVKKGIFDRTLSLKLWKPLADEGAKKYGKTHGGGEKDGLRMFSPADRKKVAEELADFYDEHIMEAQPK